MQRSMRIALVTAGLVVAGAVFGTIAGSLVLGPWLLAEGVSLNDLRSVIGFSIVFGGLPGAFLGPLAAWMMMRNVPLWLAVGGTTLGTLASGGLTVLISGNPGLAMLVGIVGFTMSAAALNKRFAPDEQHLIEG